MWFEWWEKKKNKKNIPTTKMATTSSFLRRSIMCSIFFIMILFSWFSHFFIVSRKMFAFEQRSSFNSDIFPPALICNCRVAISLLSRRPAKAASYRLSAIFTGEAFAFFYLAFSQKKTLNTITNSVPSFGFATDIFFFYSVLQVNIKCEWVQISRVNYH